MFIPHSLRIAIADDDPVSRSCLRTQLMDLGHAVVGEARDKQVAVSLARQVHPDLIVMDIGMPRLNGIQATRRIVDELPEIKVIALSVHTDKRLVALMLDAGASEYVLKDLAFEHLAGTIRTTVANRP